MKAYQFLIVVSCLTFIACANGPEKKKFEGKATAELQERRVKVIDKFLNLGFIREVQPKSNQIAYLWVDGKFFTIEHAEKQSMANLCFAWAFEIAANDPDPGDGRLLLIKDKRSGKTIGNFSSLGLSMD